jgi:hypothetical protein
MGFFDLLFGSPRVQVPVNPRTGRQFTREELARFSYGRPYYRQINPKYSSLPKVEQRIPQQKPKSMFSEMFSTTYNGPLPNNPRQINSAKRGSGFIGKMRNYALWSRILGR